MKGHGMQVKKMNREVQEGSAAHPNGLEHGRAACPALHHLVDVPRHQLLIQVNAFCHQHVQHVVLPNAPLSCRLSLVETLLSMPGLTSQPFAKNNNA